MSRRHPQLAPIALVACLLLTCLACFEDPVEEVVVIELHPEDHATITARIELLPISPEENIAAWRRVDHYRSTLLEGSDPWTRRFEGLQPLSEAYHWEKSNGVLRAVERTALIDARQLSLFFADSGVSVFVTGTDDWRELSIYPGESTRATPEQKSLLASRTDLWTSALASYFRALESVYAYMKERPDREGALFTHVFQEFVSDDELEAAADLSETEMALVDDLRAAMEEAWSVLELPRRRRTPSTRSAISSMIPFHQTSRSSSRLSRRRWKVSSRATVATSFAEQGCRRRSEHSNRPGPRQTC